MKAVGAKLYRMETCSFSEADDRMDRLAKKLESEGMGGIAICRKSDDRFSSVVKERDHT